MLFVFRCLDKPGHLSLRQQHRAAHLDYLKTFGECLQGAGPLLNDDENMCGSIVILELADQTAAESFAANDPYAKAGLFESVTIDRWNKVLP
jgi:uncharacterized protein YciI